MVILKILKSEKNYCFSVGIKLFRVDYEISMGLVVFMFFCVYFSLCEVCGFDCLGYLFYFLVD